MRGTRGGRDRAVRRTRSVRRRALAILFAAALGPGCADSASPQPPAPRVVSVLGAGSERATGFVSGRGRVVTVAHAVAGARAVAGDRAVRVLPPRAASSLPARILRIARRRDLALLGVPRLREDAVRTAGNEGDVSVLVLRGGRVVTRVAAVRRAIDARVSAAGAGPVLRWPALELEARLRAGDSGAPVLTEDGKVTGVVFARSRNHRDTAYAVDAPALVEFLVENGG